MTGFRTAMLTAALMFSLAAGAWAQARNYPLETVTGLTLIDAAAAAATLHDRKGVRITISEDALRRARPESGEVNPLGVLQGVEFSNGAIEAEIAGVPGPGAAEGARGFVGIAFRVQEGADRTYDAFYLRPTNGRAEDQERRNHSAQYVSHPAWPWFRLRKESPGRYEAYVDLVPGAWTKVRIDVRGEQARLYVHDQPQPTLVVNDLKSGARGKGGVALWIGPGTIAHFRNLTITPASDAK